MGLSLVALLLLGVGALAWGQTPTFDLNWDNQTVGAALEQLQRAFGVQYTLPTDLAGNRVTVHRNGVTLAQAMQELATAAGIRVVSDPSGKYVFQAVQQAQPAGTQTAGWSQYQPANPWATQGGGYGAAPAPMRPGQPTGVQPTAGAATGMPAMPGMPGGLPGGAGGMMGGGTAGGFVTMANGQQGIMTMGGQVVDPSEVALRVLELQSLSPELVAALFGGTAVYDQSSSTGGSSGGYGNTGGGGYGNSGYGNSGSGSSRSNSNSNYNSNSGTSNSRSSRTNRNSY